MTNHDNDQKSPPRARQSKAAQTFRQKYKVIHNIPANTELVIPPVIFVELFRKEVVAKCFKKNKEEE